MINLSFTQTELNWAKQIYFHENGYGWKPKTALEVMGEQNYYAYGDIVKYAVKLYDDENFKDAVNTLQGNNKFEYIPQEEIDILAKHYQKMYKFGRGKEYLTNDVFAPLGLKHISSYVVCRNLDKPFDIYNQGHYIDGTDKYKFVKKSAKETTIITPRVPYAETEEDLESEQCKVIEANETDENGQPLYNIKIKNEHVGILNKFAIIISVKPPAFHCGCTVSLNDAGNKIYIYAIEFNNEKFDRKIENKLGQWNNVTTVMGFGFSPKELEKMLIQATNYIRKKFPIRVSILIKPEHMFESKVNWLREDINEEVDLDALEMFGDDNNVDGMNNKPEETGIDLDNL